MAVRLSALRTGSALPPEISSVVISVKGLVIPRAYWGRKDYVNWKTNSMTLSVLEPATFRPVAHRLNHLRYRVPLNLNKQYFKILAPTSKEKYNKL
jgi:hypothetical protein